MALINYILILHNFSACQRLKIGTQAVLTRWYDMTEPDLSSESPKPTDETNKIVRKYSGHERPICNYR